MIADLCRQVPARIARLEAEIASLREFLLNYSSPPTADDQSMIVHHGNTGQPQ
jgi:hypothetical protein